MTISTIQTNNKQIMKVYSAKNYTKKHPCTGTVEFNAPEFLPSTPMDNGKEYIGLHRNIFVNTNYPVISSHVEISHSIELPILAGTNYPTVFSKGTPFLLLTPTGEIEDGYLIYI